MPRRYNDENQEGQVAIQKKLLTKVTLQKTFYHVWLNSEIETADKYVDVFDCLMQATEGDVVAIHINSPGGDLDTALQLIDAIESTPAMTIAFLEGQACSAGSMIAMACDNAEVSQYSYMMIHTFNQGISGKFSDIQSSTDFHTKWWKSVFERLYKDFCTEKEIEQILKGHELWLDADECIERFENRKAIREQELSKATSQKQTGLNKISDLIKKYNITLPEIVTVVNQNS